MFADHQGDQFTYNIWTVDKDDNWEDGREITQYIVIPRISNHKPPSMSFLTLQDYEQLQSETLSSRLKRKTNKMTGKRNRNRADDKDSRTGPTHRKQQKEAPWIAKPNDELTLCTTDLTKNEEEYDESLDPAAHLIRQPPPIDHNPDNVPVSIVTGEEEEYDDYILNDNNPLSEFDNDKPYRVEEIYNEFAPGREKLNEPMLSIASHQRKDGQLQFGIICNTND